MASLAGDDSIIKLKMGDIRKRFGRRRRTGDFGFNGIHNQSLGILGSIESNSTKWFFQHWMHEKTNESHEKMLPLGIQGTVYLIQKANERLGIPRLRCQASKLIR